LLQLWDELLLLEEKFGSCPLRSTIQDRSRTALPTGYEAKGRVQFYSCDLSLLHMEALEDSLAWQAMLVEVTLLKQGVELGGKLESDLEVSFDEVLLLPDGIDGVPEPGALGLNLSPVLLEVLEGDLLLDGQPL